MPLRQLGKLGVGSLPSSVAVGRAQLRGGLCQSPGRKLARPGHCSLPCTVSAQKPLGKHPPGHEGASFIDYACLRVLDSTEMAAVLRES